MSSRNRTTAIQRVLLTTLAANWLVAVAKLAAGLMAGSLAMIADGVHSSMDGLSNVLGLVSNSLSSRPPDEKHPYGHRRIETLASMAIGGLLLLTAWEIVQSSVQRLTGNDLPRVTALNLIIMVVTISINLAVTYYERQAGLRLNSELLLADAEHTRSDVLVSFTVLTSLIAVRLGVSWLDPAAALVVVCLIALVAWRIVQRSAGILVDEAALDARTVKAVVEPIAGIEQVLRVRSRGPADEIHVDLDLQIAGATTIDRTHAIAREVRTRLRSRFDNLQDIQVHFIPIQEANPALSLIVRAEADALGLGVHEITPTLGSGTLGLEMHVEVEPDQSIRAAHEVVTRFEQRLKSVMPGLGRVVTHIEPAPIDEHRSTIGREAHDLAREALQIAQTLYPTNTWHDLDIRGEPDGGYALSMHCQVAGDMPLEKAHHIAEAVETQVRSQIPALHRVTIHTEPRGAD